MQRRPVRLYTVLLGGSAQPSLIDLPAANGSDDNGDAAGVNPGFGSWVYVHAGICVNGTTFTGFPDASGNCADGTVRNQNNLGQNAAAFAINSPALDTALESGDYSVMQVTWLMAYINGGGETAFIVPQNGEQVPEPGTLVLLSLGLIVLARVAYRPTK